MRLIDADALVELIDDDIASLDMPREGYDVCLCTLKMVKQYIKALPTVPLDWKSILDDWTEHDNAMIAKGREIERRLNAPKHGRWVFDDENGGYRCSACKTLGGKSDFCPNCGADMREVERMAECYNIVCPYCVDYQCRRTCTCDMRLDGEYVKVKHGRWDNKVIYSDNKVALWCSECGKQFFKLPIENSEYNYCPNCGAKMDKILSASR